MECNREEGIKAKEIAEKKFMANDIMGAKKFALKAQTLYPSLEGISKMIATLDIYISAENKISGVVDWYGILGVDPQADDETIRKQYRKLALMLHPDKNKSIGADDAFKIILDAWNLLSDKAQRVAYDKERNKAKMSQKNPNNTHEASQPPPPTSSSSSSSSSSTASTKPPEHTTRAGHRRHSSNPLSTFWTVCRSCKMENEFFRCYVDCNMLCSKCYQEFLAVEIVENM